VRFVVVVLVLVASVASAQGPHRDDAELVQIKELEARLEYEQALTLVEKIIARGGSNRGKLVELHFLAGKLAAGLDRVQIAHEHFARVLSLEPNATLPDGTSPKITTPFDAARGQTAPLRITVSTRSGLPEASVEADPLHIVATTKTVRYGDWFQILAHDVHGNTVWEERYDAPESGRTPSASTDHRPFYKRPAFWGGVALGTASLAGVGAWRFSVAQDEWNTMKAEGGHAYSELSAVEDRGRRWSLVANLGLGLAILSTIATVSFAF
jgi:tetratricopeptide (TPR) repeat protein